MKIVLISDNTDTQMGLRLVGIDGVVVHEREELLQQLDLYYNDPDVAIVLVTTLVLKLDEKEILSRKLNQTRPLIVEIPDRHDSVDIGEVIDSYIREAIGLKI